MLVAAGRDSGQHRGRGRLGTAAGTIALALTAPGCLDPTQIELQIRTDLSCAELHSVGISVGFPDLVEAEPVDTFTTHCDGGYVGSLVVVPADDDTAAVGIHVVAGVGTEHGSCEPPLYPAPALGTGCIVARRALRFVPHTPLELPMFLQRECIDHPCTRESTCVDGVCHHRWPSGTGECSDERCGAGLLPACEVEHLCEGDATGDGAVDLDDLGAVLSAYDTHCGQPGFNPDADVTEDLRVDLLDLQLVRVLYECNCNDLCGCATPHPCPGDANGDEVVDDADYELWRQSDGIPCGEEGYLHTADFNDDGRVDGSDFLLWQTALGGPCPAP